jgi:uncharacterized protein YndB with AHSA1/START domain
MSDSFEVSTLLPASPERVYGAWLSSEEHGAIIGASAETAPQVGARFSMWDGYIEGTNLQLEPYHRIVQSWRTSEFPPGSPDSRLEIVLEEVEGRTRITLIHSSIPDGQGEGYQEGWVEHYFEPMKRHFSEG